MYSIACKKINDVWYGLTLDDKERIVISYFSVDDRSKVISHIIDSLPPDSEFIEIKRDKYVFNIIKVMRQIYEGISIKYNFMLALDKLSPFTRRVLILTLKIPKGFVATYVGIAKTVGNSHCARAVGNVEARNPFSLIIPCHRVVSSTLDLGGYGHGLATKRRILKREGVIFDFNRVSRECLWTPKE